MSLFLIGVLAIPANAESGWLETNDARGGVVDIYQRLFTWGHSIGSPLVFFNKQVKIL